MYLTYHIPFFGKQVRILSNAEETFAIFHSFLQYCNPGNQNCKIDIYIQYLNNKILGSLDGITQTLSVKNLHFES